jgi:hypothetical protein
MATSIINEVFEKLLLVGNALYKPVNFINATSTNDALEFRGDCLSLECIAIS